MKIPKDIEVNTDVKLRFILMESQSFVSPPGDRYTFVSVLDKAIEDEHLSTEIIELTSGEFYDYHDNEHTLPTARLSLISLCQSIGIKVEDVIERLYNYVVFMEISDESYRKLRDKARLLKENNVRLTEEINGMKKRSSRAKRKTHPDVETTGGKIEEKEKS